jgi:hypothetical protein
MLVMSAMQVSAQAKYKGLPSMTWPKLYDISFETKNDEFGEYEAPIFSKAAKGIEGKEIYIEGYIMPFDGLESHKFVLSSLPINACYFCGNGGPESVIQVITTKPIRYTEKPVELKGVLQLNADNPEELIYHLIDAEFSGILEF